MQHRNSLSEVPERSIDRTMRRRAIAICVLAIVQGAWCNDWSVSLPNTVTAQRGLCAVITCKYRYPQDKSPRMYVGIWFGYFGRSDRKTVFRNTHHDNGRYKLAGDLAMKDCSLVINDVRDADSGDYQFRIELQGVGKFSFPDRVKLLVTGLTDKPNITLPADIVEGKPVNITCIFASDCGGRTPNLKWLRAGSVNGSISAMETETQEKTRVFTRNLTFVPSASHQGKVLHCKVAYSESSAGRNISLDIKYPPKETSVRFSGDAIKEGDEVTLTCGSKSNPPATNYSWFRADGSQRFVLVANGNSIGLGRVTRDNQTSFFCTAENTIGSSNSSLFHLSVEYGPKILPHSACTRGAEITCVCEVTANPPANITWQLHHGNDQNNSLSPEVKVSSEVKGQEAISTLIVQAGNDKLNAECVAVNRHGEDRLIVEISSKGAEKPVWIGVLGGLCGAAIATIITCSLCLLINTILPRKHTVETQQAQMPMETPDLGTQTAQEPVEDSLIYQNTRECCGNIGSGQEDPPDPLYCAIDFSKLPAAEVSVRRSETTEYAALRFEGRSGKPPDLAGAGEPTLPPRSPNRPASLCSLNTLR